MSTPLTPHKQWLSSDCSTPRLRQADIVDDYLKLLTNGVTDTAAWQEVHKQCLEKAPAWLAQALRRYVMLSGGQHAANLILVLTCSPAELFILLPGGLAYNEGHQYAAFNSQASWETFRQQFPTWEVVYDESASCSTS